MSNSTSSTQNGRLMPSGTEANRLRIRGTLVRAPSIMAWMAS